MKTLTLHGLTQCIKQIGLAIEKDVILDNFKKDNLLDYFYFDNFEEIFQETLAMDNINFGVFNNENKADDWLKSAEKTNTVEKGLQNSDIYAVSFYKFDQKWKLPTENRNKIVDKLNNKEFQSFSIKGYSKQNFDIFLTETEDGSSVLFFYPKSKNMMKIYKEASLIYNQKGSFNENATATIPKIDIEEEMDYGLEGTVPYNDSLTISKAIAKNKLSLDEKGALATSAVKVSMVRACASPLKLNKEIIFNKTFTVAIFDKYNKYPSMVALIKKEDWIEK